MAEHPAHSYRVRLATLPKEARSPKDDLMWGWARCSVGAARDAALRERWGRSSTSVCVSLVQGGLWMHEPDDDGDDKQLPSALSLLSPAAAPSALAQAFEHVEVVAAARDAGAGCVSGRALAGVALLAATDGYDAEERAKLKALRRKQWDLGQVFNGCVVPAQRLLCACSTAALCLLNGCFVPAQRLLIVGLRAGEDERRGIERRHPGADGAAQGVLF